jgi:hypothetical protein
MDPIMINFIVSIGLLSFVLSAVVMKLLNSEKEKNRFLEEHLERIDEALSIITIERR